MILGVFCIEGQPVSWKNSKRVVRSGDRHRVIKSTAALDWSATAVAQLKAQWRGRPWIPKHQAINAQIVSYLGTRRLIDASGLYEGPQDALQLAGVIEDDSCIVSHDGSERRYDKARPRVEITLTVSESKTAFNG